MPGTVSVADIILAVDEPIDATQCGGRENCHDEGRCMTHELWSSLNDHIFTYLRSVTLAQLVARAAGEAQRGERDAGPSRRSGRRRRTGYHGGALTMARLHGSADQWPG